MLRAAARSACLSRGMRAAVQTTRNTKHRTCITLNIKNQHLIGGIFSFHQRWNMTDGKVTENGEENVEAEQEKAEEVEMLEEEDIKDAAFLAFSSREVSVKIMKGFHSLVLRLG